jgi:2-oxoglutarate dehydrogenase E2 component (dihydrolipoamide succinyltransferase)
MSTNIVVPELGESVVEARVAKWLKKQGDSVNAGDALVELETEKIDLEVSADRAGVLGSIKHEEGADVKVGEVLAVLEQAQVPEVPKVPEGSKGSVQGSNSVHGSNAVQGSTVESSTVQGSGSGADKKATPTAKNVARDQKVDLGSIAGSGSGGRVTKGDVLKAASPAPAADVKAQAPQVTPAPKPKAQVPTGERTETRERMSKRRATIARRLVEAQQTAAMLTTFNEVDMQPVMELRTQYKELFEKKHGVKLGFMGFFTKAVVHALKEIPSINAEIDGDDLVYKQYAHIGVAVGTDKGLVVPVIRNADQMSIAEIEKGINAMGKKARDGQLSMADMQGGTFTISNGGVYGSLMSTPILNAPQSGILGMHKIQERPVVVGGQIVIRPMMYLALSYDHRIVDGKEAVTFLVRVKESLEAPERLVLDL